MALISIFRIGDLNYRINLTKDEVVQYLDKKDYVSLYEKDQFRYGITITIYGNDQYLFTELSKKRARFWLISVKEKYCSARRSNSTAEH
jgi:hypothetical protein